jgi:hypothetical protein
VGYHLVAFGGKTGGLFRGAIMQSGSALGPASAYLFPPCNLVALGVGTDSVGGGNGQSSPFQTSPQVTSPCTTTSPQQSVATGLPTH